MGILLLLKCRHILYKRRHRGLAETGLESSRQVFRGRCGMRHMIVAATMLMVALVVTFGAASLLQGAAMANGPTNTEPFVIIEAAKPAPVKSAASKEKMTSQFRERQVRQTAQVGL